MQGPILTPPLPDLGMTRIARRQLHVILALDCSGSMRGSKIASLDYAMRAALPEIRAVAADNPEVDVRMRVLRFATGASWLIEQPVPVDLVEWPGLIADGETQMGMALGMIADRLTPEAMPGRQLPAVIVLVSDGFPSDDFETGLKRLFEAPFGKYAVRIAVAIGSDADLEVLERFIAHPTLKPLQANNAQDLVQQIKWATTMPVKSVSSPRNAPDHVAELALDASRRIPAQSDIVW